MCDLGWSIYLFGTTIFQIIKSTFHFFQCSLLAKFCRVILIKTNYFKFHIVNYSLLPSIYIISTIRQSNKRNFYDYWGLFKGMYVDLGKIYAQSFARINKARFTKIYFRKNKFLTNTVRNYLHYYKNNQNIIKILFSTVI